MNNYLRTKITNKMKFKFKLMENNKKKIEEKMDKHCMLNENQKKTFKKLIGFLFFFLNNGRVEVLHCQGYLF